VVRQSNDKTGAESTAAQLDFLHTECGREGMCHVDKVVMEGVAASAPAKLEDIEKLFARKKKDNDFDVIALQVPDRLSRSGGEHGMWLEHEAKRHGLRFFAGDDTPDGPYAAVVRVAKYEAAREFSVGNGKRSSQGQMWQIRNEWFRTSGPTPMGCDRMYYGDDHQQKFIIRNLRDGRQEQIEVESGNDLPKRDRRG
jgi:hypothetical protein